jgi:hypothetical protein
MPLLFGNTASAAGIGALVPIATSDMNGATTAFGFSNIPQTYEDLMIVASMRSSGSAGAGWIINNNESGMTFGTTVLSGNGASASSSRGTSMSYGASYSGTIGNSATSLNSTMVVHFLNYTNASTKKTWLQRTASDFNGSGSTNIEVFSNSVVGAITSMACSTANGAVFWTGTATLYGIKAGA